MYEYDYYIKIMSIPFDSYKVLCLKKSGCNRKNDDIAHLRSYEPMPTFMIQYS